MIDRNLTPLLKEAARQYPVVLLTGPRQSGKTTLCQATFPDRAYVTLEPLDQRESAIRDPRGFLEEYRAGAIIDEVQQAPDLLSYLQEEVDRDASPGRFILTGSQHFGLTAQVAQSLAGRCAVLTLLPPSLDELRRFPAPPGDLLTTLWMGAYPRIHDRGIPAQRWLSDYLTTYVQRDVRQVLNIGDLLGFTDFVRLCAGRSAQEINLSRLGGDAGVSHNTARQWLSVLEAGYLIQRLPAWHTNQRKQIVKAPKLHFIDSGLACHLLDIREPDQIRHHPLRGALFESWVAAEALKRQAHAGLPQRLYHYRESRGLEVDLLIEEAGRRIAIESKSGATIASDFFAPLEKLSAIFPGIRAGIVYGGDAVHRRDDMMAVPWDRMPRLLEGDSA
ncbi:MAG: ATP-binding protein [Candidatus Nitricoxidivorans perseverans]|uniref:ATP-binding protein n=1 Tax=Candidatus Nitricoxidivorans perseverans TaxID=2975601 RepID=A0AA49IXV6_9PROT|nr:MAG: ATP-binding protein [Candidatus Nitricoxidivorans perseverans]